MSTDRESLRCRAEASIETLRELVLGPRAVDGTLRRELVELALSNLTHTISQLAAHNVALPVYVPAGFVRVRVGVAITQASQWHAWGAHGAGDLVTSDQAVEGLEDDAVVHYVEADVPVPQQRVVEGVVT